MVGGNLYEQHDIGIPMPPDPPRVSVEQFAHDPAKMAAWATATTAAAEFKAVLDVAELLHAVTGGQSTPFGAPTDGYAMSRVMRFLPEPAHLAVFDALGWKPGLHVDLRPPRRRPPDAGFDLVGGVRVPAGWQLPAIALPPLVVAGGR